MRNFYDASNCVDWKYYLRDGDRDDYKLSWHCSSKTTDEWKMDMYVDGFNECMITYLLAIACPVEDKKINVDCYNNGWARNGEDYINESINYGYKQYVVPNKIGIPLFWTHYSYLGFDPRGKNDGIIPAGVTYYDVFKNIALIDHAYCSSGPYTGYSSSVWGLTSSDDPYAIYREHFPGYDNGTITPTAAISSMPYTPSESIAALKYFYLEYRNNLMGVYGFRDAFNLKEDWWSSSYVGIDQGPIIIMIENYRTQLCWKYFMSHSDIITLLTTLKNNGWILDNIKY